MRTRYSARISSHRSICTPIVELDSAAKKSDSPKIAGISRKFAHRRLRNGCCDAKRSLAAQALTRWPAGAWKGLSNCAGDRGVCGSPSHDRWSDHALSDPLARLPARRLAQEKLEGPVGDFEVISRLLLFLMLLLVRQFSQEMLDRGRDGEFSARTLDG